MDTPLQAELSDDALVLYAPNRFVLDWVRDKYLNNINGLLNDFCGTDAALLYFKMGSKPPQMAVLQPVSQHANELLFQAAFTCPRLSRPSWDNALLQPEPS